MTGAIAKPLNCFWVFTVLTAISCGPLAAQENGLRQWTSRDGTETAFARLSEYDSATRVVTLVDQSGALRDVKLERLALADQRFVQRFERNQDQPDGRIGDSMVRKTSNSRPANRKRPTVDLYGIQWQRDFETAMATADGRAESDRQPIMWFRVLGDLDGFM